MAEAETIFDRVPNCVSEKWSKYHQGSERGEIIQKIFMKPEKRIMNIQIDLFSELLL